MADSNTEPGDELAAAQAAVESCRRTGDRPGLANALIVLSAYLQNAQRFVDAIAAAQEGVGIFRELGNDPQLGRALENLAVRQASAGRFDLAVEAATEQSQVHRRVGNRQSLASALTGLSSYLQNAQRPADAIAAAQEGVGIFRELGNDAQLDWALENLNARYAAAPGLRVMRATLSTTNLELLRSLVRELRLDVVGGLREQEGGLVRAEAYVTAQRLDELRSRGVTVEVTDDATATGLARHAEVARGNRFADGTVPAGLGTLIEGDAQ